MTEFVRVAAVGDLPSGERMFHDFEDITVTIFNVDGEFFCIEDVCTHDGGPLGDGILLEHCIECPRHGAMFDIRDGSVKSMPAVVPVPTYQVKVEGEDLMVESPDF